VAEKGFVLRLDQKVALLSGGAGGMGTAQARLFSQEGAKVVIGDLDENAGTQLASEINQNGGHAIFVPLNVVEESSWREIVDASVQHFARLDILVNNAGILRTEGVVETSTETWDLVLGVNTKGTFLGIKHVIPTLRQNGGGSIINLSSGAGLVGSTRSAAYHASKGAVRILTKSAAIQYAHENIRVNSIHPGPINTQMLKANLSTPEGGYAPSDIPLGRRGQPEEIAYGALYLASDEAKYVTGSELVIDGGLTAQ